jgi:hypothetical protein
MACAAEHRMLLGACRSDKQRYRVSASNRGHVTYKGLNDRHTSLMALSRPGVPTTVGVRVVRGLDGATTIARPPRAPARRSPDERPERIVRDDPCCGDSRSPADHSVAAGRDERPPIPNPLPRRRADRLVSTKGRLASRLPSGGDNRQPKPSSTPRRTRPVWRPHADGATP